MYNYQKYRHIQPPGWTLGWPWSKKEVIWSMVRSQATEQGDCSKFKGNIPHCCKRNPSIVDLLPVQQEMFEREVAQLRNIYQQQQQQQMQQQQQTAGMHSRSSSRDLDSQFASLFLKHKEPPTNSGREPVSGPLRI